LVDTPQLRSLEPNISGEGAIYSPRTGIVDFRLVCEAMAERFKDLGGEIHMDTRVVDIEESQDRIVVHTGYKKYEGKYLIACSGLMADRMAALLDIDVEFELIPFRGEFYRLSTSDTGIINHLIYPIPNPDLPFLGVHLTRRISGEIVIGPNAVLSLKREGYGKFEFCAKDVIAMVTFPGFWKVIASNFSTGCRELTESWVKPLYIRQVRKYLPGIQCADLVPYPAGVRAQPVTRDGMILDDFLFASSARSLHVCNAPSPAATSAIPIGEYICDRVIRESSA
jgi:L-2-hydroxyglutarate oxidase